MAAKKAMKGFQDLYKSEIFPDLQKHFNFSNPMQVPKLDKISINIGLGVADKTAIEHAFNELMAISGQRPVKTLAKNSNATFKVRKGMVLGVTVTLRGARMYQFLERLVIAVLPRIRDFRGLSKKSFDGRGNFCLGIKEQVVFPEIDYDKIGQIRGMDINIITTAKNNDEGLELLKRFFMPFNN